MPGNNIHLNWTMHQDKVLISFVKKHEPLYNVKCKDYRKSHLKLNLWRKLAKLMRDKTDTECAKRWAYVRDYYVRRKGKEATNEAARRRAEQLSLFLHSTARKRAGQKSEEASEDVDQELKEEEEEEESPARKLKIILENEEMSPEKSGILKRQKTSFNSEERSESTKKIPEESQSVAQDETDLFFASMAKSVKRLPEKERVYVRLEIGSIVGNAELRYLEQQNYNDCTRLTFPAASSTSNFSSDYNKEVSDI